MVRGKVRIRFKKTGDLRLISHHDLMRCFERMLRRASIPYHSTSGFNPKPRLIFAMPLPLGISGSHEVVELELDAEIAPADIQARLAKEAPAGLEFLTVERIEPRTTAHVKTATYCIALDAERYPDLPQQISALLAADSCWIERERPQHRRVNLRSFVNDIRLGSDTLEMELIVTPNGTARPDEILRALGLGELIDAGVPMERTKLEIEDECLAGTPAANPPG
jgi:radical SAM-linked protein